MSEGPQLQFSLPVLGYVSALSGLPQTIHPILNLIVERPFPALAPVTILSAWRGRQGRYRFGFNLVLPDGTSPFRHQAEAEHEFHLDDWEYPFLWAVFLSEPLPEAGTFWIVLEVDGSEVLRYPWRVGPPSMFPEEQS